MNDNGDLQMSFDELADLVVKLVAENTALEKRVTQLEVQLWQADEAIEAIATAIHTNTARAADSELARHSN